MAEEGVADPVATLVAIDGTGGAAAEAGTTEDTNSSGSAYAKVRGLLTEPVPRVGTGQRSEKMSEQMESFDQRWDQRPVSGLVSAGKKMAGDNGSVGLNRLLGLSTPATIDQNPAAEGSLAPSALDVSFGDSASEEDIRPIAGDGGGPPGEQATERVGSESEQVMTLTPTARMVAAQNAYAALSPLEADIFRSQAAMVTSAEARRAAERSQELALDALASYERETIELQQLVVTMRAEADMAVKAAVSGKEALTTRVHHLEGQLEIMAAELRAARRAGGEGGDDSEGGAELAKGHDDLGVFAETAPLTENIDAVNDVVTTSEAAVINTRDEDVDEGGGEIGMDRGVPCADKPTPQWNFGE